LCNVSSAGAKERMPMKYPVLYRKRLIPAECLRLKDDVILHCEDDFIVTGWKTINPRKDMDHGYSLYMLKEGIKVSKFYRADNSLLYWYCDIVEYQWSEDANTCTSVDLLADVVLYPDGSLKVLDLDELALAAKEHLITDEMLYTALTRTNTLLNTIYRGDFVQYKQLLEKYEK